MKIRQHIITGVWLAAMAAMAGCFDSSHAAKGGGPLTDGAVGDGDGSLADIPSEPTKLADVPGDDLVALHLYVSNQSWDPEQVDIRIRMNGTPVVAGWFDVGGQHNWIRFDLMVPRGTVRVRAEALGGEVLLEQTVEVSAERWAVLDYWYYPDEDPEPFLMLSIHDEPIAFAQLQGVQRARRVRSVASWERDSNNQLTSPSTALSTNAAPHVWI